MELFLTVIVAFASLIIAVIVLKRHRNHTKLLFGILCITIFVWSVANYFSLQNISKEMILFWMRVVMANEVIQCSILFLFIHTFPQPKINLNRKWLLGYLLINLLTIFIAFSPLLFSDVKFENNYRIPVVAPGMFLFLLVTVGSLLMGFILLIKKYRNNTGIIKSQIRFIILGTVIMFLLFLIFNFGIVILLNNSNFVKLSPLFTLPFILSTGYAISKYRFLDIRVAFQKNTVKLVSYLILFAFYLLIIFAIKDSIVLSNKTSESTFLIISTLVIVITIEPFRYMIYKGIDKIFESNAQKLDLARKRAQVINFSQTNFETLNNQVMAVIKDYAEVKAIRFIDANDPYFNGHFALSQYLKTTDKILVPEELAYREEEDIIFAKMKEELAGEGISCFVPIGYPDFFAGAYALGPRPGQKAYTVQDIEQLRQFQSQFTNAILNAKMYQMAIQRITKN